VVSKKGRELRVLIVRGPACTKRNGESRELKKKTEGKYILLGKQKKMELGGNGSGESGEEEVMYALL